MPSHSPSPSKRSPMAKSVAAGDLELFDLAPSSTATTDFDSMKRLSSSHPNVASRNDTTLPIDIDTGDIEHDLSSPNTDGVEVRYEHLSVSSPFAPRNDVSQGDRNIVRQLDRLSTLYASPLAEHREGDGETKSQSFKEFSELMRMVGRFAKGSQVPGQKQVVTSRLMALFYNRLTQTSTCISETTMDAYSKIVRSYIKLLGPDMEEGDIEECLWSAIQLLKVLDRPIVVQCNALVGFGASEEVLRTMLGASPDNMLVGNLVIGRIPEDELKFSSTSVFAPSLQDVIRKAENNTYRFGLVADFDEQWVTVDFEATLSTRLIKLRWSDVFLLSEEDYEHCRDPFQAKVLVDDAVDAVLSWVLQDVKDKCQTFLTNHGFSFKTMEKVLSGGYDVSDRKAVSKNLRMTHSCLEELRRVEYEPVPEMLYTSKKRLHSSPLFKSSVISTCSPEEKDLTRSMSCQPPGRSATSGQTTPASPVPIPIPPVSTGEDSTLTDFAISLDDAMTSIVTTFLASPPKLSVFLPTFAESATALQAIDTRSLLIRRMSMFASALTGALLEIDHDRIQWIDGTESSQMNRWWLEKTREAVDGFLDSLGYDFGAVPWDYTSVAPQNMDAVKKNYKIISEILDEDRDQHHVVDFLKETCTIVYERIDDYVRKAEAVISDISEVLEDGDDILRGRFPLESDMCPMKNAQLPMDPFTPSGMQHLGPIESTSSQRSSSESSRSSNSDDLGAHLMLNYIRTTQKDISYLNDMKRLDPFCGGKAAEVPSMDLPVPVSGLLINKFKRLENELRTTLDRWG